MRRLLAVLAVLSCTVATARGAQAQAVRVAATSGAALDEWSARVDRMLDRGELSLRMAREDTLMPGRVHERFTQLHRGVPVFGGELARQSDGRRTLTVFGALYEGIDVDVVPAFAGERVEGMLAAEGVLPLSLDGPAELMVLPRDDGGFALAYRRRGMPRDVPDVRVYFLDARSGRIVLDYGDLKTQVAGTATGVLGDAKKISTRQGTGGYTTNDGLRPPVIKTYDFRGDVNRYLAWEAGRVAIGDADLASDSDNVWTDGAVVDAHVYAGYTYDYYFKRFGRRGLDNANVPMSAITHTIRREDIGRYATESFASFLYCNAFYLGRGIAVFGEGLPPGWTCSGRRHDFYAAAIDIVAHEFTHGVTEYTSNLIYRNESGALNEAFSDIMGAGVEFFFQEPGSGPLRSDYLHAEDTVPGGNRSLQNPTLFGHPDHYSIRYLGPLDGGGVHSNSGIANHAFYLAIEGGTHRLSGLTVQGVGFANREQIERVFYRGFTSFLTRASDFAAARAATIQAARELYGIGSTAERAVTQAWTAVGVN